jgi:hypothetical protein
MYEYPSEEVKQNAESQYCISSILHDLIELYFMPQFVLTYLPPSGKRYAIHKNREILVIRQDFAQLVFQSRGVLPDTKVNV